MDPRDPMCEEMMLKYCTATAAFVCGSADPQADILLSLLVQKAASDRCSHATSLTLCCLGTACEGRLLSCNLCKAQYFVKSVNVCLQAGSNEVSALACTPV